MLPGLASSRSWIFGSVCFFESLGSVGFVEFAFVQVNLLSIIKCKYHNSPDLF